MKKLFLQGYFSRRYAAIVFLSTLCIWSSNPSIAQVRDYSNEDMAIARTVAEGTFDEVFQLISTVGSNEIVQIRYPGGLNIIHFAALNRVDPSVIFLIVQAGADVNAVSEARGTPLLSAVNNELIENAAILISLGARFDIDNGGGQNIVEACVSVLSSVREESDVPVCQFILWASAVE